jgi:large subunit ribosomal protein L19
MRGYDHWVEEDSNMTIIDKINDEQLNPNVPEFRVGDTVSVGYKIVEKTGEKVRERIQVFEGIVIARKGSKAQETFTVRKLSSGVGVERIFPVHSPKIASIEVVRKGVARRAKLHFARNIKGQFKLKERN